MRPKERRESGQNDLFRARLTMRLIVLLLTLVISCGATFAIGLYAGVKQVWPVPQLRRLVAMVAQSSVRTDQFDRLLSYPGKIEITCPIQDEKTAVLLLVG